MLTQKHHPNRARAWSEVFDTERLNSKVRAMGDKSPKANQKKDTQKQSKGAASKQKKDTASAAKQVPVKGKK